MPNADPNLLWKAPLLRGAASLRGNCNAGDDDFCVLEVVRAAQAQILPGPVLRLENNFYDGRYTNPNTGQTYTEQRAMCDVAQLQIQNGDETVWRTPVLIPQDWVGWYPKWDELTNWPGDSAKLLGGHDGGSIYQIHHAPPVGSNDWSKVVGSAPLYIIATDKDIIAKFVPEDQSKPFTLFPLVPGFQRGQPYDIVLRVVWSPDPIVGVFEARVDGKVVVPPTRMATSFHNISLYPIIGFYRRQHVGDPALTWPADAKPGVTYPPEFVPRKGTRVFAKDDGYPQSVQFPVGSNPLTMSIGKTWESVMAIAAGTPAPAPSPTQGGSTVATTTGAPEWLWKGVRGDMEKQLAQANDAVTAAQDTLTKAQAHRDALKATLDNLAKRLDSGAGWLNP